MEETQEEMEEMENEIDRIGVDLDNLSSEHARLKEKINHDRVSSGVEWVNLCTCYVVLGNPLYICTYVCMYCRRNGTPLMRR